MLGGGREKKKRMAASQIKLEGTTQTLLAVRDVQVRQTDRKKHDRVPREKKYFFEEERRDIIDMKAPY